MEAVTYTDACANLKGVMDAVIANRTPVVVTRQGAEPVVIISLSDWSAITETLHLVSNPSNTARLHASIAQFTEGKAGA